MSLALTVLIDFVCVIAPFPVILQLKLRRADKLSVLALMALGVL